MGALPKISTDNVIEFDFAKKIIRGGLAKRKVKLNKDGSVDKRHCNKVAGVSSEVYPFTSELEIKSMVDVFNKRIDEAPDENKRQIAARNKMLFLIGINLGIRASDLCELRYSFFYNDNGEFKDSYSVGYTENYIYTYIDQELPNGIYEVTLIEKFKDGCKAIVK